MTRPKGGSFQVRVGPESVWVPSARTRMRKEFRGIPTSDSKVGQIPLNLPFRLFDFKVLDEFHSVHPLCRWPEKSCGASATTFDNGGDNIDSLTCCHGSYSGSPPFTIYRLGNKKNHSQVGQIFLNHSQVGQAITAEATTLAPWAKLGRRASRHDDHNMKHRGAIKWIGWECRVVHLV